jgi:hypothetical protein
MKIINPEDIMMLNWTGGAEEFFKSGRKLHCLESSNAFEMNQDEKEILRICEELLAYVKSAQ